MKVWTTLSDNDIYDIANGVGVCIADRGTVYNHRPAIARTGRAYNFGLRPDAAFKDENGNYMYQRTSASAFNSERRVFAVCWHGHRDFMRAIFEADPDARIKTMWADYRGSEDFEEKFPGTAYRNVGSMMYPMRASEVCAC